MLKAFTDDAWEDFQYWLKLEKKTIKRILKLIEDIEKNAKDESGLKNVFPHFLVHSPKDFFY